MNATFAKALVALIPACALLIGSSVMFFRRRNASSLLQLIGANGLLVVGLTHVCEALNLLSWMKWGIENSPGHYLDLVSAIIGVTFFAFGYLAHAIHRTS